MNKTVTNLRVEWISDETKPERATELISPTSTVDTVHALKLDSEHLNIVQPKVLVPL